MEVKHICSAALFAWLVVAVVATGLAVEQARDQVEPASRLFRFEYGLALQELPAGGRVRVWLPVPQSSAHQTVAALESSLPAETQTTVEPKYGNKMLYFETTGPASGRLACAAAYRIGRHEVRGLDVGGLDVGGRRTALPDDQRTLFLSANSRVPLEGKQLTLLQDLPLSADPVAIARALYDRVDAHVRYDKSRPGYGHGDVLWVCDSRFGNCTDFHSLFIALSRAQGVPARFEIGFPLPPKRGAGTIGGYHCWAWFYVDGRGWTPVDISEADKHPELKQYYFGNLTEDRVTFTVGRDIDLQPKQEAGPLNFFVYPYVEVDGRAWPADKVKLSFRYRDL